MSCNCPLSLSHVGNREKLNLKRYIKCSPGTLRLSGTLLKKQTPALISWLFPKSLFVTLYIPPSHKAAYRKEPLSSYTDLSFGF